jgi:hypothetical protein
MFAAIRRALVFGEKLGRVAFGTDCVGVGGRPSSLEAAPRLVFREQLGRVQSLRKMGEPDKRSW